MIQLITLFLLDDIFMNLEYQFDYSFVNSGQFPMISTKTHYINPSAKYRLNSYRLNDISIGIKKFSITEPHFVPNVNYISSIYNRDSLIPIKVFLSFDDPFSSFMEEQSHLSLPSANIDGIDINATDEDIYLLFMIIHPFLWQF